MMRGSLGLSLALAGCVAGCGAAQKAESAPKTTAPQESSPAGYPAQAPAAAAQPSAESPARADGIAGPPPDRRVAMIQAAVDLEASQRELELAPSDCQTACRALGSMDRSAGRLCALAQTNDEIRRCEDARVRLYSARDKVRSTCGGCSDVSVDRNAPIPSR